ncbi:DoxX family protein [Segniliparus rotundus DSM 44985]|uniref:DoxX family protein n=1 Tax=Segniliparus rotundus (strain ATCC BAA-972 / CDC 1076 / CIP 108378 / DSM 44985 / JCM 13578) TaxID=640132 RepID=D6Z9F8_SEGRD|nr:MauE/DoxX family redox-associated membrane protein [Segniliparus rotundus]ADG98588.1 DoxX family protein [Segniliparus rotundus DSM 44985]
MSTAARLGLAAVWLYAGLPKLFGDPTLNELAVSAFRVLPDWAVRPVAGAQPALEVALGVLLLAGLGVRVAAVVSAMVLLSYIAGIVWVWAHGYRIDCGCFSKGGEDPSATGLGYAKDIARDAGFLVLAAWLAVAPRSWAALGPRSRFPAPLESSPAPANQ